MIRGELPIGIIAVLQYANPDDIENIADSWKMSSDEKRLLVAARNFIWDMSFDMSILLLKIREQIIIKKLPIEFGYVILSYYDQLDQVDEFNTLYDEIPEKMPFDGNDVMAEGFTGKRVGEIMNVMREFWINSGFPERDVLIEYFKLTCLSF